MAEKTKSSLRNNIIVAFFLTIVVGGTAITISLEQVLSTTLIQAGLDEAVIKEILRDFIFISTGLTIVGIFIVLLVAIFLSKTITSPIERLTEGTKEIASGKLDVKIDVAGQDEFGQLADSFNQMTVKLKESYTILEEKVRERTKDLQKEIAERKKIEEDLRSSNADLEAVNRELDIFTYSASHDLKEPLRGIQTFANFILEDYWDKLDDDGKGYLKRMMAAATRMKNLIDDLLALSRITKIKRPYESVDAEELAKEAARRLDAVLSERGVEMKISKDLPIIYGDKVKLSEVFYNLISNGIKYNKQEKPVIEIDSPLQQPEKEVVVYVKDNGIGIKEEYHDTIFEIFRRLHHQDEYGGGTGAGLAIVKRVIDDHKGKIRVESEPGQGSTFYLSFPKRRD